MAHSLGFIGTSALKCDPQNPQEAFLYILNSPVPEIPTDGIPVLGEEIARLLSVHLWNCGARIDPKLATRRQVPSSDGTLSWVENARQDIDATISEWSSALSNRDANVIVEILEKVLTAVKNKGK